MIGTYEYSVTVTDNNGCTDEGNTGIITVCAPTIPPPFIEPMAAIAGTITTEKGEMVERTTISLGDYEMAPEITGATGNYQFDSIPMYNNYQVCLLYTSPSPRDATLSRMPSSA